jgi:hypothetical protein
MVWTCSLLEVARFRRVSRYDDLVKIKLKLPHMEVLLARDMTLVAIVFHCILIDDCSS